MNGFQLKEIYFFCCLRPKKLLHTDIFWVLFIIFFFLPFICFCVYISRIRHNNRVCTRPFGSHSCTIRHFSWKCECGKLYRSLPVFFCCFHSLSYTYMQIHFLLVFIRILLLLRIIYPHNQIRRAVTQALHTG